MLQTALEPCLPVFPHSPAELSLFHIHYGLDDNITRTFYLFFYLEEKQPLQKHGASKLVLPEHLLPFVKACPILLVIFGTRTQN